MYTYPDSTARRSLECRFLLFFFRLPRHALPESPPDSGSEPPYSPPGHNDTQHVHSPREFKLNRLRKSVRLFCAKRIRNCNVGSISCRSKSGSARDTLAPSEQSVRRSQFIASLAESVTSDDGSSAIDAGADASSRVGNAESSDAIANRTATGTAVARAQSGWHQHPVPLSTISP